MSLKKTLLRLIQFLLIGVIFYFLIRGLLANWSQVKDFDWKFDYYLLTLSVALQILTLLWLLKIWKSILRRTGSSVAYRKLFKAWFISNLGKYVPGKVWQFLGMLLLLESEGIPKMKTFSTGVLGQTLSVISGLLVSALFFGLRSLFSDFVRESSFNDPLNRIFHRSFSLGFLSQTAGEDDKPWLEGFEKRSDSS